ncbi:MAG TPA: methylated-DNA--[protein]-cysteine S-methyltransferase [Sphingomonas sp.]|jgi:AraC family transcriptional regulator of adaptative response/methylated-DNA-[protein]-cysteine methyltransferase|uniref:bifunctional transcriptional activator/DNA repair enzyme AdaA n=1 Tax=Sphingomonas sp. TaxID=28214 RepID=UPI002EDA1030
MTQPFDPDAAWAAFDARDRSADGRFVVAVRTTRIYCKPSCPARRPKRENVEVLADGAAARAAGYRACLRCRPDEVARDVEAVARAARLIEGAADAMPLAVLADRVGYAPHHFQRLFTRALGVSPAAYRRGLLAARGAAALVREESVTDAVYEAGYAGPSGFYANAAPRLGMTPARSRGGGAGVAIGWVVVDTTLGPLLVAATERGLCRVAFEDTPDELARRFPRAAIAPGGDELATLAARVVALVERPSETVGDLPLDVRGTAFQEAVWAALKAIPPGETRTYGELAAAAGNPGAVRAAGSACGANPIAVVVPCHRVLRSGGGLGGYAWGLERKRALGERERG